MGEFSDLIPRTSGNIIKPSAIESYSVLSIWQEMAFVYSNRLNREQKNSFSLSHFRRYYSVDFVIKKNSMRKNLEIEIN